MNLFKSKKNDIDNKIVDDKQLQKTESEVLKEVNHKRDVNKILLNVFKIFILVLLTLSLVHVPYVGAFFDSVIFSLLFGWTKYIAYAFIYLLIIFSWFPNTFKKFFKFKYIFSFLILWFLVATIISSIGIFIDFRNVDANNIPVFNNFSSYFFGQSNSYIQYWLNNDWANVSATNKWFYLNPHGYGGLPAFFFVVIFEIGSPIILIILSVAFIGFIFYLLFRNFNKKVKQKKLINSNDSSSSKLFLVKKNLFIKEKYHDLSKFIDEVNKAKYLYPIGKINNIISVSNDYVNEIEFQANEFIKQLDNFFEANNLVAKFISKEIMYQSFIVKYKFLSKSNLKVAKEKINKIETEFLGNDLIYWFDGEFFLLSQKLSSLRSTISIKDIIKEIDYNNHFCIGIGKFSDRKSYFINGLYEPNLAIYGSLKGDGRGMLLSNIVLSLAILNGKDLININLIDINDTTIKNLNNLPQVTNIASNVTDIKLLVQNLINLMNERLEIIHRNNCKNIYEYNLKNKDEKIMPIQVIVINDYDDLILWDKSLFYENFKIILENSQVVGFIIIASFGKVNVETASLCEHFNNIVALKLNSENESNLILGDTIAKYLWGSGDMILKTDGSLYHLQSAYVNQSENNEIKNEIIKNDSLENKGI